MKYTWLAASNNKLETQCTRIFHFTRSKETLYLPSIKQIAMAYKWEKRHL